MSAGPQRLEGALSKGIPTIISVGATDMVDFGPVSTVPECYRDRKLHVHNAIVTVMRTDQQESYETGKFISNKIRHHAKTPAMVRIIIPTGISMISKPGGPFEDQVADERLREAIRKGIDGSQVSVKEHAFEINDDESAGLTVTSLLEVLS